MKMRALARLNSVWALANWRGTSAASRTGAAELRVCGRDCGDGVGQQHDERQPKGRAAEVEEHVGERRAHGGAVAPEAGQQRGHAGADVGPQRHRDARLQPDQPLAGQGDDDRDGGGRGLKHRRHGRAERDGQQRPLQPDHGVSERRPVAQGGRPPRSSATLPKKTKADSHDGRAPLPRCLPPAQHGDGETSGGSAAAPGPPRRTPRSAPSGSCRCWLR